MASFSRSAANALGAGYDIASPNKDSSGKTAYQRYIEKYYGPDVQSHNDPIALARAATGAVEQGLKTGAGWLGHAAAGLLGMPTGPDGSTYGGGIGSDSVAGARAGYNPSGRSGSIGAGLSSPGVATGNEQSVSSSAHEALFQAISEAEGTTKYGYNTVYGGGNGVAGRPLTDMTIREIMNHQADMIHNTNHSPVGRFQITRDTINSHYKNAGLSLDSKFDQSAQNKLALSIADKQGIKPSVWAGFNNNPGALSRAKQAYSSINQATPSQASYATSGPGTGDTAGITYNIRDRTSAKGLTSGLMGALGAAQKAARDAGLDHIEVRAGKGQGHLSHQQGTEADIVGYNKDGSTWSKAQRVAVAQGAAGAGANRFGFYSGPSLHVGMGAKGLPSNVVWNDQVRGLPGANTFAPEERSFVGALRTGKLKSLAPSNVASAYAPTTATTTPALQAAAGQATGRLTYDPQVAATQRDLNSRGAKIPVDGLRGPLTRQAEQQFYGSPTSVRTPSFTYRPTYTSGQQDQGAVPRVGVQSTPAINQPYTPAAATPRTPYYNNPYTNSTGGTSYTSGRGDEGRGVNAPFSAQPRAVPTESISGSPMPPRPFQPAETARIPTARPDLPGQNSYTSGRQDQGRIPPVGVAPPRTPYLNQPYTMTTGGANAIVQPAQTARIPQPSPSLPWSQLQQPYPVQAPLIARIPQARPDYQPPQEAVPTLIDRLGNLVERAERALSGNRGSDSRGSSNRDGGSSRGGGGNYSGGNYGGQGGSRISEGVGGAYRNR
jgi:uncharacterized membrane protein YgcG